MARKSIVIVGAGPIGLEAALYAQRLGHDVQVFERGRVGENMRRWGFIRMFSHAGLNRSALGVEALSAAGRRLPADETYLTGTEHVESYLKPLAELPGLSACIHPGERVVQIGREHIGKGLPLGNERAARRFRLLLDGPGGERFVDADVVLDCTGTYGNSLCLGSGNIPAPGERAAASGISYVLRDIGGADRGLYEGRRVLLVGAGHSACTALDALVGLPATQVVWITRDASAVPSPTIPNDPLPERDRLSRRANGIAADRSGPVRFLPATCVESMRRTAAGLAVTLRTASSAAETVVVDTVLAHVGFHPDATLYRELQVHECYASQGPMRLAATLMGQDSSDCLAQAATGPDALLTPEPDFYVLGAKSYGRNSRFLIRLGLTQVRDVFTLIEGRPELNLYAA